MLDFLTTSCVNINRALKDHKKFNLSANVLAI
jgi:hypothetical protein